VLLSHYAPSAAPPLLARCSTSWHSATRATVPPLRTTHPRRMAAAWQGTPWHGRPPWHTNRPLGRLSGL
jgi:hypothetical protein